MIKRLPIDELPDGSQTTAAIRGEGERMLIVVGTLVLVWLVVFLPVIGLLIAEGRRCAEERKRIANAKPAIKEA